MATHEGLLMTIARRWERSPEAVSVVPFDRVITGRIPNTDEYPFPYMSILPMTGRLVYRSDRAEGVRQTVSFHIWTDPSRLEEDGERTADLIRRIYADQSWCYNYGKVIDVLDCGPAAAHQIDDRTFQAWEVVKLLVLCIEQARVGTACSARPVRCNPVEPSGSSSGSGSSYGSSSTMSSSYGYSSSSGFGSGSSSALSESASSAFGRSSSSGTSGSESSSSRRSSDSSDSSEGSSLQTSITP